MYPKHKSIKNEAHEQALRQQEQVKSINEGIMDVGLLKKAIDKWGKGKQIDMIQEECIELALAIQKLRRNNNSLKSITDVVNEIADVKIMIVQAELLFSKKMIDKAVAFKMKRLEKKVNI